MIQPIDAQSIASKLCNDRTMGLELECFIPSDHIGDVVTDLRSFGYAVIELSWNEAKDQLERDPHHYDFIITTDGSLERTSSIPSHYRGREIITKPLRANDLFDRVEQLTDVLNSYQVKVNSTCGLHLHIDVVDFKAKNLKNALNFYKRYEKTIDCLVAESRRGRGARYCTTTNNLSNDLVMGNDSSMGTDVRFRSSNNGESIKYHKLNLRNYHSSGTLEFRHFNSTTDFTKIVGWISICNMITSKASQGKKIPAVEVASTSSRNTIQGLYNMFLALKLIKRDKGEIVPFSYEAFVICKWMNARCKSNGFENVVYNVSPQVEESNSNGLDKRVIATTAINAIVQKLATSTYLENPMAREMFQNTVTEIVTDDEIQRVIDNLIGSSSL